MIESTGRQRDLIIMYTKHLSPTDRCSNIGRCTCNRRSLFSTDVAAVHILLNKEVSGDSQSGNCTCVDV